MLVQHVVGFLKQLYTAGNHVDGVFPCRGYFPSLSMVDKESLLLEASNEEIRRSSFSMSPLKAPGVDGFQAKFFQSQWEVIAPSVYCMVRKVLMGHPLDPSLNRTLLVMIPKIQNLELIKQFRPISLCTMLYKIVIKTTVN